MKLLKLSLAAAVLATVVLAEEAKSEIGVSANVAMTSNYVWRGMSQTLNSPATQGGFDLDYNGLYAGVWGSNVNFGDKSSMEADLYLGYAGEVAGIGYDIGAIQYAYPNATEGSNFAEVYVGLSYDLEVVALSATYSMGQKTDTFEAPDNVEIGISAPLPAEIALDVAYGMYDTIGDYYSAGLSKSLGKFDYSLAYTGITYENDAIDADSNIVVTVATSF